MSSVKSKDLLSTSLKRRDIYSIIYWNSFPCMLLRVATVHGSFLGSPCRCRCVWPSLWLFLFGLRCSSNLHVHRTALQFVVIHIDQTVTNKRGTTSCDGTFSCVIVLRTDRRAKEDSFLQLFRIEVSSWYDKYIDESSILLDQASKNQHKKSWTPVDFLFTDCTDHWWTLMADHRESMKWCKLLKKKVVKLYL